jgi:hypothetical protein
MSKLIVWRFLTSNLRTNKADIKEINLKLIKVTPSYGIYLMLSSHQNLPLSKEEGIWKRKIGV